MGSTVLIVLGVILAWELMTILVFFLFKRKLLIALMRASKIDTLFHRVFIVESKLDYAKMQIEELENEISSIKEEL